jgi:hypothetical protein
MKYSTRARTRRGPTGPKEPRQLTGTVRARPKGESGAEGK